MDAALTNLGENSFSLFVLYLVISSNFLAPLFSCKLREFIEGSMFVRHILGFLTLTFFVVVASKTKPLTFAQVMGLSGFFYTWFILTTRMHLHFWFIVISLVGAIYLIHLYQSNLTSDTPSEEDSAKLTLVKQILAGTAGVITLLGFLSYAGEKKIEYKGGFSIEKFLLGAPSCKSKSPKVGFFDSLKGLFRA
jgi:hypothetical protein